MLAPSLTPLLATLTKHLEPRCLRIGRDQRTHPFLDLFRHPRSAHPSRSAPRRVVGSVDRRLPTDPLDRAKRYSKVPGNLSDPDPGRQHLLHCTSVDHPEDPSASQVHGNLNPLVEDVDSTSQMPRMRQTLAKIGGIHLTGPTGIERSPRAVGGRSLEAWWAAAFVRRHWRDGTGAAGSDQVAIADWVMRHGQLEHAAEDHSAAARASAVEAKDELVEVARQVSFVR